ncbi:permease [Paenibacillus hunanensis]|uniref:Drug/metabolite transporter (DMT)-like permease n=1 Tax=Paenibacillus hunanensis TaxID=539262 RepID=A0ABU1ITF6_9BACL|nr:drug/metabolite transporter (DMT)-like permease [Paenibacillus hunanensis]GGJ00857.1 permease [Paenibacillus hunanensis]
MEVAIIKQEFMLAILFLGMTLFGAFGGFSFKRLSDYPIGFNKGFLLFFMLGGSLYFLGAIFNIILLRYLPYTLVYPLSSITYVWTTILAYFLLAEKMTLRKIVGILLIIMGALLLIK